jgi:hypothetical protein
MARHTIRGTLDAGGTERLILDDGIFTMGHRVKSISIIGANNGAVSSTVVLHYSNVAPAIIDLSDGDQLGWALWNTDTTNGERLFTLLDPDHVSTQDLHITSLDAACGFLVEVEPVSLTEAEGVLQMVKQSRQS